MQPINKSVTRIVNLTDKCCNDLPIYKKEGRDGRATKVRMMKREKVLSGNYLFVVQFLQVQKISYLVFSDFVQSIKYIKQKNTSPLQYFRNKAIFYSFSTCILLIS